MTIHGAELKRIGAPQDGIHGHGDAQIFKMQWEVDADFVRPQNLESLKIPLQSDKANMSQPEKVSILNSAAVRFIEWAVEKVQQEGLVVKDDYRIHLFEWMAKFVRTDLAHGLIQKRKESKTELLQLLGKLGTEGETLSRFGPQLASIVTGDTDPLSLFLEDNLLYRVYHADIFALPNRYLAEYMKIRTHQRSDLKILEIGAGTGGTTLQMFQLCSPDRETFCSEYAYTDISSGFFDGVRTTTLKDWQHMMTFNTLDLEKDPQEQGFEEHYFDVVIAANVVHATKSLKTSLERIHWLLKPGGRLALVEIVKTTPFINLTFGSIAGWWAGKVEAAL